MENVILREPLRKIQDTRNIHPFEIHSMRWIEEHRPENLAVAHRHDYYVIIWVKQGRGTHLIDYEPYEVHSNAVYFLSPGQVHLLRTGADTDGWVVSFLPEFLPLSDHYFQLLFDTGLFHQFRKDCGRFTLLPAHTERLERIFQELKRESEGEALFRSEAICANLELLLIQFARLFLNPDLLQTYQSRAGELVRHFLVALEQHFRTEKQVGDYAARLGVTANHLNEVVKRVTGYPSSEHIRNRVILEAKRLAGAGRFPMKEIAYQLGFDDAAHFSKYFKNATGLPFSDFKEQLIHQP